MQITLNDRARYYDPSSGRFLSEDPIGFAGGDFNLYRYVSNRPTLLNDPRGTNGLTCAILKQVNPDAECSGSSSEDIGKIICETFPDLEACKNSEPDKKSGEASCKVN
ncbi:MAG: RHS repeat-associated core domain-containing protein [Bacteriovoracaceae bacterium]|nr:RHS repeat-associated core domain-containing protein [Bacteriovoracaceae bacterium]